MSQWDKAQFFTSKRKGGTGGTHRHIFVTGLETGIEGLSGGYVCLMMHPVILKRKESWVD